MKRNYLHLTNYCYCKHGALFKVKPKRAASGLVPLKKNKPPESYGGYTEPAASFFTLVLTEEIVKKKKELMLVPIDLMFADKFLNDATFAIKYVRAFIEPKEKKDFSVKFPFGIKPIKIKTIFEVDNGLRFILNGKNSGGSMVRLGFFSVLLLDEKWERYIKCLESFREKKRTNPKIVYVEKFDRFSSTENIQLYDLLTEKLRTGIFAKRPANPLNYLEQWRDMFCMATPENQAEILLNFITLFGKESGSLNLSSLHKTAPKEAGENRLSCKISAWKKYFSSVRIIDSDASGLHETKSINLLDLI